MIRRTKWVAHVPIERRLMSAAVVTFALATACNQHGLDGTSVPTDPGPAPMPTGTATAAAAFALPPAPAPSLQPAIARPVVRLMGDDFVSIQVEQGVLERHDSRTYRVRLPVGLDRLTFTIHAADGWRIKVAGRPAVNGQPWTTPRLRSGGNEYELVVHNEARTERYQLIVWNGWSTTYVKSATNNPYARLGVSVALSDDGALLAAGAPSERGEFSSSGAAYLFGRQAGQWRQETRLVHEKQLEGDNFGESLSLSADGKRLAAGTPVPLDGVYMDNKHYWARPSGDVNIFDWSDHGWQQVAGLYAEDEGDLTRYGHVTLSGDGQALVVGAPDNRDRRGGILPPPTFDPDYPNAHIASGAVYAYQLNGTTWIPTALIKASAPGHEDYFGGSLGLSQDGTLLVVGASLEDGCSVGAHVDRSDQSCRDAGAVYVFVRDRRGWIQEAYLKPPGLRPHFLFGYAVAISADGSTLAVVSPSEGEYDTDGPGSPKYGPNHVLGAVYLFRRVRHSWLFEARLQPPRAEPYAHLGQGLALSRDGNVLAVGGSADILHKPLTSGSVHVFHRSAGKWSFGTTLKASAPEPFDWFGNAIAISADGTSIAVGAEREDGGSSGIGGDPSDKSKPDSGAVYVFESLVGPPSTNRTPQSAASATP